MSTEILQKGKVTKQILIVNIIITIIYLSWWFRIENIGNPMLYAFLFFGELYHVFMALSFWSTVLPRKKQKTELVQDNSAFAPSIDIYIPVAGEPVEVVRKTVKAAKLLHFKILLSLFSMTGMWRKKRIGKL